MGPIVEEVKTNFADKSIQFVVFDFTSDSSKAAAESLAKSLGVEGTYAKYAGKTGFALVYDTKTQKVITKLNAGDDAAGWGVVLDKALGGV